MYLYRGHGSTHHNPGVFLRQSYGLCCGTGTVFTEALVTPYSQWLCRGHGEFGVPPCPRTNIITLLPAVLDMPFVHVSGHSSDGSCPYLLRTPEGAPDPGSPVPRPAPWLLWPSPNSLMDRR